MVTVNRFLLLTCLISGQLVASSRPAHADDTARARVEYRRGWTELESGNVSAALSHYQRSFAILPRPRTAYNIAVCLEKLDQPERAIEYYEKFLGLAEARDAGNVELARASIARLTHQISGDIRVDSLPRGAAVYVDGATDPAGQTPLTLGLVRGDHQLTLQLAGYDPLVRTIHVREKRRSTQVFRFDAATIKIEVEPRDAVIRLEGDPEPHRGVFEYTGKPGTFRFTVSRKGFEERKFVAEVKSYYRRDIELRRLAPDAATLLVVSRRGGAAVSVDGLQLGLTHIDGRLPDATPTLSHAIKPGLHTVVVHDGHQSTGRRLELRAGETVELRVGDPGGSVIRSRGFLWTLVGVGGGALAGGAVLGVLGLRDVASPRQEIHGRGKRRALEADVLSLAGTTAILGAWYLHRTTPPDVVIRRVPQ